VAGTPPAVVQPAGDTSASIDQMRRDVNHLENIDSLMAQCVYIIDALNDLHMEVSAVRDGLRYSRRAFE